MTKVNLDSLEKSLRISHDLTDIEKEDLAYMLFCSLEEGIKTGDHRKYVAIHDLYWTIEDNRRCNRRLILWAIFGILVGISIILYFTM